MLLREIALSSLSKINTFKIIYRQALLIGAFDKSIFKEQDEKPKDENGKVKEDDEILSDLKKEPRVIS